MPGCTQGTRLANNIVGGLLSYEGTSIHMRPLSLPIGNTAAFRCVLSSAPHGRELPVLHFNATAGWRALSCRRLIRLQGARGCCVRQVRHPDGCAASKSGVFDCVRLCPAGVAAHRRRYPIPTFTEWNGVELGRNDAVRAALRWRIVPPSESRGRTSRRTGTSKRRGVLSCGGLSNRGSLARA